jgi:hypothetical protein
VIGAEMLTVGGVASTGAANASIGDNGTINSADIATEARVNFILVFILFIDFGSFYLGIGDFLSVGSVHLVDPLWPPPFPTGMMAKTWEGLLQPLKAKAPGR